MAASWSGIRKKLEQEYLCDSLKGRVQYFMTHYHGAPDREGRFCIRVDGKEYVPAHPYNERWFYHYSDQFQKEQGIPNRVWNGHGFLYEEENRETEQLAREQMGKEGLLDLYHITEAIELYCSADIQSSLRSENPVVRLFAVLDRRVGKRTLQKLKDQLEEQPEWLRFFYELRLSAEGILPGTADPDRRARETEMSEENFPEL